MASGGRSFTQSGLAVFTLFFWAGLLGSAVVHHTGGTGLIPYGIVLAVPVIATGLLMLAIALAPSLLPDGRVAWPANLTLPLLYSLLMVACVAIGTSTGNSLVLPNDLIALVGLWVRWPALLLVLLFQVASLSLFALVTRRKA